MTHQITLFAHGPTPNPLKVAILLEELNVDYVVENKVSQAILSRAEELLIGCGRNLVMARTG